MRDHVLLQAIARVNRPYEDEDERKKTCGFILDFVGIFDKLEKALAFDSGDVAGVVKDIEVLKYRFTELIGKAKEHYFPITENKTKDKAVEALLQHFMDEKIRHEYYDFFREVSDIYEIISPDAFLRSYIDDFETLARMYKILREAYEPGISVDKEFTRKTAKLVQKHTHSGNIKYTIETYEIDENTLRVLEDSSSYDTEKVFNLLRSIGNTITRDIKNNPHISSKLQRRQNKSQSFTRNDRKTLRRHWMS